MEEIIATGKFLSLVKNNSWEFVKRNNASGVVVIIGVTSDDHMLFVEQYREPFGKMCIELPAGLVGDHDTSEAMFTAAQRELLEETGYAPDFLYEIGAFPVSCGLTNEAPVYVIGGCHKEHDGGGVGSENIIVHCIPVHNTFEWLMEQAKSGKMVSTNTFSALSMLENLVIDDEEEAKTRFIDFRTTEQIEE